MIIHMLPSIQKAVGPVLLLLYVALSASAWFLDDVYLPFAWITSFLVGMYLTMRLTTFCKVSPWDSFWRPAIGLTSFWVSFALVVVCTPNVLLSVNWQVLLLACLCLTPLVFAWRLRARDKRRAAHAFIWLHLLGVVGATQVLDQLGLH